jgi:hypothetical protein
MVDRGIGVKFSSRPRDCSLPHSAQTGSGALPESYPVGTGAISSGLKRPERDADYSQLVPRLMRGAVPPLQHTPSLCCVWLSSETTYLYVLPFPVFIEWITHEIDNANVKLTNVGHGICLKYLHFTSCRSIRRSYRHTTQISVFLRTRLVPKFHRKWNKDGEGQSKVGKLSYHFEAWSHLKSPRVRTSQETYYVSAIKPNRLMRFRETIAVYCENHTKQINTLWAECRVLVR